MVEETQFFHSVDKETEVPKVLAFQEGGKNLGFEDRTAMILWAGHCPQTHWCHDFMESYFPTMRETEKAWIVFQIEQQSP